MGIQPRTNIVIFAETRAEWLLAAHGCFQHSLCVCTIYATLGEEGVIHGVTETDVDTIITSHDLLPKFKNILKSTPNVKTIIFFEDQLHKTDTEGFGNVNIIPFSQVLKMGINSTFSEFITFLF